MNTFSNKKNGLFLFSIVLLMIMISFFSCKKNEVSSYKYNNLSVLPKVVRVGDSSGSVHIKIYSNGNWNAKVVDSTINWLSVGSKMTPSEKSEIVAHFKKNNTVSRSAKIAVTLNDITDTITFNQEGDAFIHFKKDSFFINSGAVDSTIEINTNIPSNLLQSTISYLNGADWVKYDSIEGKYLKFGAAQNGPFERKAKMLVSFTDIIGNVIKDSIILVQKSFASSLPQRTFSYVKNNLPSGMITDNSYIKGVVISDKNNPNMARNHNLTKTKMDKSVNKKTVYIQSIDEQEGIKLVTASVQDNEFKKNTIVKIWIKGLTLVKHTNPSFVTLKGLQLKNIIYSKKNPNPLNPKKVSIKNLTDNDLFTYVSLKNVEISIPDGSFRNVNEGYDSRADTYAMNIRGIDGGNMYMLFNYGIPYARTGKQVPQGSGSISGILVHEDLPRYGGDIGKYEIRPTDRSDIDLSSPRFSKVLVKWTRFKKEYESNPTANKNPLTPDIGSALLTASQRNSSKPYAKYGGIYGEVGYNGLTTTGKGLITNGAFAIWNWWGTGKGNYWLVKVSTLGITTPLTIAFNGNSKIGGPRNWALEWSSTGTAGSWKKVADFTLPDIVSWGNTLYTQLPGFKGYSFQLPIGASGLPTLYVRLVVTNKIVGTKTSADGGTMTYTGSSLLGYLSIEYNK